MKVTIGASMKTPNFPGPRELRALGLIVLLVFEAGCCWDRELPPIIEGTSRAELERLLGQPKSVESAPFDTDASGCPPSATTALKYWNCKAAGRTVFCLDSTGTVVKVLEFGRFLSH